MNRVTRSREVKYQISYVQKRKEIQVYLGPYMIGRIYKTQEDVLHRQPHYVGFVNLPAMIGPIVREDTEFNAKVEYSAKVRKWLERMGDLPNVEEERPEKETRARVSRAPRPVMVETRSRVRGR